MVIKKYIAQTEDLATQMAQNELGKDVVIMNVKKTTPKGLFKLFRKPHVELTAAIDDTAENAEKPDFSKLQEAIRRRSEYTAPDSKAAMQEAKRKQMQQNDQILPDEPDERVNESVINEQKMIEQKLSKLQNLLEKQMGTAKETETKQNDKTDDKMDAYFQMIKKKMLENEVQEQYVDQILKEVKSGSRKEWTLDNVLAGVYQKIILKIGQPHLIDVKTTKTKYIFFVGPTGVGKTTTIAKIASTLKLTKKTRVALITADTYRIAAVEQLKTYANILGIPLEVVYSAEDKEVYLVLSATTKYKDLKKISEVYRKITEYYLIFTKLDETDTVGNIFNIHMLTGAQLSYATWGQNVPDDIGKMDAQKITKQLLGGNG